MYSDTYTVLTTLTDVWIFSWVSATAVLMFEWLHIRVRYDYLRENTRDCNF